MSKSELDQIKDFTTSQYIELLKIAKVNYKFIGYPDITKNAQFILWRHDCDCSLNRSLRLAQIENEEQVKSTYFLNPHCAFYNLLEKSQLQIVKEILDLGHDIGLHFDADYYDIQTENQLDKLVEKEATWLNDWFGVNPNVFSFHNPTEFLLSCEHETYAGLLNCYSKTFKDTISYCSDSNGYWRFRRLHDVLEKATDLRLQVLTHPAWWQEKPMYPRERIFRSVYGRAVFTMNSYDEGLQIHKRDNLTGPASNLNFLKQIDSDRYQFYDYLWNTDKLTSLFIELYRLHEHQILQICKITFCNKWFVSLQEVNTFFEVDALELSGYQIFDMVFDNSLGKLCSISVDIYDELFKLFNQLVHGRYYKSSIPIYEGCTYLCKIIRSIADWGESSIDIQNNGITEWVCKSMNIGHTKNTTEEVLESQNIDWLKFCQQIYIHKVGKVG